VNRQEYATGEATMQRSSGVRRHLQQFAVCGWIAAALPLGAATLFTNPTTANVLRQLNLATGTNLVPNATNVTVGCSFIREGVIDGSGWNDEVSSFNAGDSIQRTFTLPGLRTVGGWMAQFDGTGRRPTQFTLEGYDGSGWVTLLNTNPTTWAGDRFTGTFTPGAYSQIRYTAYGPLASDTTFGLNELHVYMAAGQNVAVDSGYSIFRDQNPTGAQSANKQLPDTTWVWRAPNGGSANTLKDADFTGSELKSQNVPGRSFVTYTFADLVNMRYGTLGGNKGQGWGGNWEVYTANGVSMPSLQGLDANDPAAIQAAGWTLQYAYTSPTYAQSHTFLFASPYDYRYLALVWDSQWASATEFELFGLPEPGTAASLGSLVVAFLLRRRRR
jgi:hypothetical protein